ncbi:MAG: B/F/G family RNA polymerase sigma-70 factor, partial [Oscillospiraceae bacterium]|nr:B/F/G family RNA polymerase sigma-70 factor [Oscillospiraceae bacterium]
LSEDEREFNEYRYNREMSQKEIAELKNTSQMQVSRFERRLLKKLKNLYFRD